MAEGKPSGPRSIALIGPYMSGKTTLLESIVYATGGSNRKGSVIDGNTVGDFTQESRDRQMGTELNVASISYLDDEFTILDCPGSIELAQEALDVLQGVDAAVIVAEPDIDKALSLAPILHQLDRIGVPRMLFLNKVDRSTGSIQPIIDAIQPYSQLPLVLRHMPLVDGEDVTGYVDLSSDRTFAYRENEASERIDMPQDAEDEQEIAKFQVLETLADFDDDLMEKLLDEVQPETAEVYAHLTRCFQNSEIVPVLIGAALHDHGVRRLLKAMRHEVPVSTVAAERVGIDESDSAIVAQVLKTYHTQHAGKLSVARIWSGQLKDGAQLNGERISGIFSMKGAATEKLTTAGPGTIVGLGRLETVAIGDTLSDQKDIDPLPTGPKLNPVYSLAISAEKRDDEVKLSGALGKLVEEDRSLTFEQTQDTHQLVLRGQGDIHLKIACDRLRNKYGLSVGTAVPRVPYKEALRRGTKQHGRHKKQSGGHGQFGDVHIEIEPLPRGTGFQFEDKIVGGVVPRQFIPAVENGVKEAMRQGPLGFEVVDVCVRLYDGQHHSVDSSEIAFKLAGRVAMTEGMPNCDPVLLEPILKVEVHVPSEFTPKVNQMISSRRGQVLGFDARDSWPGWDTVQSQLPQTEIQDMIVELRSLSQGTGSFDAKFDHLQPLVGRNADIVIEANRAAAAA